MYGLNLAIENGHVLCTCRSPNEVGKCSSRLDELLIDMTIFISWTW